MHKCNWDNLPNELKMMCIEKTDFKTRANLMLSNRHNKMLVEIIKSKYLFDYVEISTKSNKIGFSRSNELILIANNYKNKDYIELKSPIKIRHFLESTNIRTLEIDIQNHRLRPLFLISKMSISKLKMVLKSDNELEFSILRNCDENLEEIVITNVELHYQKSLEKFLKIPQVIRIQKIHLEADFESKLVKNVAIRMFVQRLLFEHNFQFGQEITVENGLRILMSFVGELPGCIILRRRPAHNAFNIMSKIRGHRIWTWSTDGTLHFRIWPSKAEIPDFQEIAEQRDAQKRAERARLWCDEDFEWI